MKDYLLPRLLELLNFPFAVVGTLLTLLLFLIVLYIFVSLPYTLLQAALDRLERWLA